MVLGDLRPGVPLDHGIGDLGGLGGVERLRQIAQVHDLFRGNVLVLDLHILRELAGDGVLIGGGVLELLQQLLQRALIGGGADELAVHVQAVGLGHQADLIGEILLEGLTVHHFLAGQQRRGIRQLGRIDAPVLPQGAGGLGLQILTGGLRRASGADRRHNLSFIGDGGAHRIEGEE